MLKENIHIKNDLLFQDALLKQTFKNCNFILKNNYNDNLFLKKLSNIISNKIPSQYNKISYDVNIPFLDYLSLILDDFDDNNLLNLITLLFCNTDLYEDDKIDYDSTRATISKKKDEEIRLNIIIPKTNNTNILYAAFIHELIHFPQLLNKNKNIYEYSEVLSMYFEYLMYEKIEPNLGYEIFINNRLDSMRELFKYFNQDLFYALNPDELQIPLDKYSLILATHVSYLESFEYVLQLIDKDRKMVNKNVSNILLGNETFDNLSKSMNINSSEFENTLKLIKQ